MIVNLLYSFTFPNWVLNPIRGIKFFIQWENLVFILDWFVNSKSMEYRILM